MILYHLTLNRASGIQCAVYGNFSAPKQQEIIVSRGKIIELLRPNEQGRLVTVVSTEVFSTVRSLAAFRLTGAQKDYLIVGSDSGRIVILEFHKEKNTFIKVHQETFGKSGCRRIVPGQYLAADPKGRACMIAGIEKQKFVYVLNRDSAANLTISSPLEAHKSHTIVFSVCGLDCGFDNPIFAAIELSYEDADQDPTGEAASYAQKHLTFYELDLGLNHVVRKWSDPVDNGANLLIPVPGGADGPGGCLVCAENFIIYKNQDHEEVRAVIPRRNDLPGDRGVLIVSYAAHKKKQYSFFLVQSEYGDIYKVTLAYEGEAVSEVKVKVFDTIPPCVSICVLKTGFLFAASEFGNHALYQFVGTGEDEESVESSSATLVQSEEGFQPVFFDPRPLKNLVLIDEQTSLMPVTDMQVANLTGEEIPQIYCLCGRGPRSSLAVLRPGLAVTELAVSPLPGAPTAVWTIKRQPDDEYDAYIVVSFSNATIVFSIGDEVKEVSDSGFLATTPTLHTQVLADGAMLQVHPGGLRHITPSRRINEWRAPGRRQIQRATSNLHQVAVALSGGEVVYFELDPHGQLLETEKRDLQEDVACMDIAPVPEGRQRCRFLAVGLYNNTMRMFSLDPGSVLQPLAVQQFSSTPESVRMLYNSAPGDAGEGDLFLHAGLSNGVLQWTQVDNTTGKLSNPRMKFLGAKAVRLFTTQVRGQRALLALSTRPFLGYSDQGRFSLTPLSYEALEHASSFASDQCPEGLVSIVKSTLRILMVENVGEAFNQQVSRLRYTPRKMVLLPHGNIAIAESDVRATPLAEREDLKERLQAGGVAGIEFDEELSALEEQFGAPKGGEAQWASCLRIVEPQQLSTKFVLELEGNETPTSMCLVSFAGAHDSSELLAVGTAVDMVLMPLQCEKGCIHVYRVLDQGSRLELLHKTEVEGIPGALASFKGRLLAGVGSVLRLYDLGRKKLLRKCEFRKLPHHIMSLRTQGSRIYVGDAQESVHYMRYSKGENQMYIYADDIHPRYLTCMLQLDYDTIAAADKFGNVFVVRLPAEVSAQVEDDPTGGKLAAAMGKLNGAPHKLTSLCHFHVGDTVTSLQLAAMVEGGEQVILYTTIMGSVGALIPIRSKQDHDFLSHLEMYMRQEAPPLAGRDHLAYRSSYFPVKDVIDGDLCSQFPSQPAAKQKSIAEEIDRTPGEVLKKLEDLRNKVL